MFLKNRPTSTEKKRRYYQSYLFQNAVTIQVLADRCYSDSARNVCRTQAVVSTTAAELNLGAFVQVGSTRQAPSANYGWCVKKVTIGGELIDFYDITRGQISRRGCPKSTMGCKSGNTDVCGEHASCRNKIGNTPMYICRCHPGYQPDTNSGSNPVNWKCYNASQSWQLTGKALYWRFIDKLPRGLRISFRTRTQTFKAFAVDAWMLTLRVSNGVPELVFGSDSIRLGRVNVSDGNWHLFDMTFTPNFMDLRVDELDREFYNSTYFATKTIRPIATDTVIGEDAGNPTCIDDAWIDFDDAWPDYQRDYPLVNNSQSYAKHVEWTASRPENSCDAGQNQCAVGKNPCGANETCVTEWRGYRCDCVNGTTRTSQGACVPVQCWPNPCVNGICSGGSGSPNGTNFTCSCHAGWTGDLCDRVVAEVASAGLTWWAILLIVLLILLIIIIIVIIVCCCKRRRKAKKTGSTDVYPVFSDGKLESESQFNEPWGPTERDFNGSVDHVKRRPIFTPVYPLPMNGTSQDLRPVAPATPNLRAPRDYGQKTSSVPPWEKLEAQNSAAMNLDQVLEYGYEGYDGKPPPEFCVSEPISIANDDGEESDLDRPNRMVLTGGPSRGGRSLR